MQRIPQVILTLLALTLIPISHLDTHGTIQSDTKPSYELEHRQKRDFAFKFIDGLTAHPCSKYEHGDAEDYVNCINHEDHISQSYMKSAAWWQLLATIAGLILIWRTLVHSRNAATSAKDTVEVAKAQLKAIMRVKHCSIVMNNNTSFGINITYVNSGQSLAKNVKHIAYLSSYESKSDFPAVLEISEAEDQRPMTLSQGDEKQFRIIPKEEERTNLLNAVENGQTLHLNGIFTYENIFGEKSFLKYSFRASGPNLTGPMYIVEMRHS